jgi:hypothetical protein
MTYFYFSGFTNGMVESDSLLDWDTVFQNQYGQVVAKNEIVISPTLISNSFIAEKYKWCCDHVPLFRLRKTSYRHFYNPSPVTDMWSFEIYDPMEAVAFKLRWQDN